MNHCDYNINERGIYTLKSGYGDHVEYNYLVEFDSDEVHFQFIDYMKKVWKEAGDDRGAEIRSLLGPRY